MLDLEIPNSSLVDNFRIVRDLLSTNGPSWLDAMRHRAFSEFQLAGIPSSSDEEFKYLALRPLQDSRFKPAYGATVERGQIARTLLGALDAATITFVNGEFAPELSSERLLSAGVFVGPLEDGFHLREDAIQDNLGTIASLAGKLGSTNDERFVHLNTAYLGEGAFIYVPRGVSLPVPIHIQWIFREDHGPFVSHPRTLIVLEEDASATIVESYLGLGGVYFTNAVTELSLGQNARIEFNKVQCEAPEAIHIATVATRQLRGSTLTSTVANFGARIARNDVNVSLDGQHTETRLNGLSVGLGSQIVDNHTRIDHAQPNCHSFETYKSVLGGRSTGIFNGKIYVYQDAQKTDAKQTNQAMLLSPGASMNTKPQLEIFADDVKCTHGATVGQLSSEALFYLLSRGIPAKEAQALLVYAFAAEILEKVTVPGVKESLEAVLLEKLKSHDLSLGDDLRAD